MGRHSRKGPAPKADNGGATGAKGATAATSSTTATSAGNGRRRRSASTDPEQHSGGAAYGTPAHGTPAYGTPAHGTPQVRGGHPEQREPGGGWGAPGSGGAPQSGGRYGDWQGVPRGQTTSTTGRHPVASPSGAQRQGPPPVGAGARIPGPRREFVEAFDETGPQEAVSRPGGPRKGSPVPGNSGALSVSPGEPLEADAPSKPAKGRTFTGIAAAAVTTVLAVVVAGQVTDTGADAAGSRAAGGADRGSDEGASRSDNRLGPQQAAPRAPAAPPTYAQLMAQQFPLDAKLKGPGGFEALPGFDKAPGKGRKVRYRIDVEKGLGLDGKLFAQAVQQTLNDDRSWAHDGAMSFERVSSGKPEFVITLASPGTTAVWCAKSGLDTSVDNVSCDSASTDRVMINAYRWAQGSETYGAKAMLTYRQMLINHEVGHRLGNGHVNCSTPGALAPVMQQQTKSLDVDGVKCRPNPWVYPGA
ncbi:DUF3152 domain-containing protein [Streptomyces sp. NPDC057445]|uniref:DUF3152 domain-containing protein n=1 Tax=Streptomyces sp. NPDC057445 TaxID=3346136 RepID=UPI0036B510F8